MSDFIVNILESFLGEAYSHNESTGQTRFDCPNCAEINGLVNETDGKHNLEINYLAKALKEINNVAKYKYIMVESYRNNRELFNLQCWALTCESFFSKNEWKWLFKKNGYTGDYEFIYFE